MNCNVFTRTFWKENAAWPNGLEPAMGRKTYMARNVSENEARAICKEYNATHKAGRLSRKAEYEAAT